MPWAMPMWLEDQAHHPAFHHRRPAAVARVDGRVHLDAQARDREVVAGEFDAGDDPLGDGEVGAAHGIAVRPAPRPSRQGSRVPGQGASWRRKSCRRSSFAAPGRCPAPPPPRRPIPCSPASVPCTCTWLAYLDHVGIGQMRRPASTTAAAGDLEGSSRLQGLTGSGTRYRPPWRAVAPGIDLALLKLDDDSFFDARKPLPRDPGDP